jgi:hypothetical protein
VTCRASVPTSSLSLLLPTLCCESVSMREGLAVRSRDRDILGFVMCGSTALCWGLPVPRAMWQKDHNWRCHGLWPSDSCPEVFRVKILVHLRNCIPASLTTFSSH